MLVLTGATNKSLYYLYVYFTEKPFTLQDILIIVVQTAVTPKKAFYSAFLRDAQHRHRTKDHN